MDDRIGGVTDKLDLEGLLPLFEPRRLQNTQKTRAQLISGENIHTLLLNEDTNIIKTGPGPFAPYSYDGVYSY